MRHALALAVVVVAALPRTARADDGRAATTTEQDEDYVTVKGRTWGSPRGVSDVRIKRELLDASPRQQTSEMLSAAPGFFVDHEDGEGLGNDVFLRGFDLAHGSGIEMRLGAIPLNVPLHVLGQGYVDANFVIPEVVRSIRVLEGPYDPRQGDAAIVGSAYFDIGVPERGYQLKSQLGSFDQKRLVAIAAPRGEDDETFAAVAFRNTDGFGQRRRSRSLSAIGQYAVDVGIDDRLKLTATAYGTSADLAGVVRRDDVDAHRIGFEDSYSALGAGQGVDSSRFILGLDWDHETKGGTHIEIAPWAMWTTLGARRNFTGNLEIGIQDPALYGLGDLYELSNREGAVGFSARAHRTPYDVGPARVAIEPGITLRFGHTDQSKSLLRVDDQTTWDRRLDARLNTVDAGAYFDIDGRLRDWHLAVGPRADVLAVGIDDRLTARSRTATGLVAGPHATLQYERWPELVPVVSYGEGFRSLDADRLRADAKPYSRVRSFEAGLRSSALRERVVATAAAFQTYVENELVFEAEAGGLETERASYRRGVVSSLLVRPTSWLLVSSAFSVTRATFTTLVPGISHYVPSIPAVLFRTDASVRGELGRLRGRAVSGRIGVGYTLVADRHLSDDVVAAPQNILNASAALRWEALELGVDGYNALGLRYPDDEALYASNWTNAPRASANAEAPASIARHITAAPPRTVVATVAAHF